MFRELQGDTPADFSRWVTRHRTINLWATGQLPLSPGQGQPYRNCGKLTSNLQAVGAGFNVSFCSVCGSEPSRYHFNSGIVLVCSSDKIRPGRGRAVVNNHQIRTQPEFQVVLAIFASLFWRHWGYWGISRDSVVIAAMYWNDLKRHFSPWPFPRHTCRTVGFYLLCCQAFLQRSERLVSWRLHCMGAQPCLWSRWTSDRLR